MSDRNHEVVAIPSNLSGHDVLSELLIGTCDCGKVTTFKCHELWDHINLTPCNAWLCGSGCTKHRHEPSTMGYVGWTGKTDYKGDVPDGPGLWDWVKSWLRFYFWSPGKKARSAWAEMQKNFAPPAPLPKLTLIVEGIVFETRDGEMVEVGEEVDPLDEGTK